MKLNKYIVFSGLLTILAVLTFLKLNQLHHMQISFADVCNMDLTSAYGVELNEGSVVLDNGLYKKQNLLSPSLTVSMPYARGDFNGDLLTDFVFFVYVHSESETYTPCDLVLIENRNGKPFFMGKTQSDICDPTSLKIDHQQIILEDDSFSKITEIYEVDSGELVLVQKDEEENEP